MTTDSAINPKRHRYRLAIALVLAAAAVRATFLQPLGSRDAFGLFYPAVLLAALYGGRQAGWLATFLSGVFGIYFLMVPRGSSFGEPSDWLALVAFLTSCLMVAGIAESMHRAQCRATEAMAEARLAAERARADEQQVKTRDRFNGIISAALDAVISTDSQQRIILFNPAAERMFRVPAGQALGKNIDNFIPARFRSAHAGYMERFGKTNVSTRHMGGVSNVSGIRGDGEEFPIEASISQVEVDGERLFSVILRDITHRQRAEAEVRASRERLRALAARLQTAREEERTHAAREIHDVLAQELTSLKLDLAWLGRRLGELNDPEQQAVLQKKVTAMTELTDQASRSVQRIATELRPPVLDSLGLCAAAEWVAADFRKRTEIDCTVKVPPQGLVLDRDRSTALFRILQESLTNVVRHARATHVEINLQHDSKEIVLTVCDNGCGIHPGKADDPGSIGLLGMRERAALLQGQCAISNRPAGGSVVEVRLPLESALMEHLKS
jgi:PAS domain S-box-containing protein